MAEYWWQGSISGDLNVAGNYLEDGEFGGLYEPGDPATVVPGAGDTVVNNNVIAGYGSAPATGTSDANWFSDFNSEIDGGTFNGSIQWMNINGGVFNGALSDNVVIYGGTFNGTVDGGTSYTEIYGGTFNGPVGSLEPSVQIEDGLFNDTVHCQYITTGQYHGAVQVDQSIDGGTFNGNVRLLNAYASLGVFNAELFLDGYSYLIGPNTINGSLKAANTVVIDSVAFGPLYAATSPAVADPADVRAGVSNLGATGTLEVGGTGGEPDYPAQSDVRDGVLYADDGMEGALDLPPEADVKVGVEYDNQTKTGSAATLNVEVSAP